MDLIPYDHLLESKRPDSQKARETESQSIESAVFHGAYLCYD